MDVKLVEEWLTYRFSTYVIKSNKQWSDVKRMAIIEYYIIHTVLPALSKPKNKIFAFFDASPNNH